MKTTTIFLVMLLSAGLSLYAQTDKAATEKEAPKQRVFGLGFKTSPLNLDEMFETETFVPGNRVIMTVNAHPHFRIQPEMGYYHRENKPTDPNYKSAVSSLSYGISAYGMWQKEQTVFYAGPKVSMQKITNEYKEYVNNNIWDDVTETNKTSGYGLGIGGEYLFGKHFSAGTELAIMKSTMTYSDSSNPTYKNEYSGLSTSASLLFHFYF